MKGFNLKVFSGLLFTLVCLAAILAFYVFGSSYGVRQTSASVTISTSTVQMSGMISFNFDDGFESSYNNVLPLFDKAGFKTTQFIITGKLKTSGYVNEKQVLHMAAEGHEIGAHTRTHPHLNELTQEQIISEIAGSRQDLQDIGVTNVRSFAYPFGQENQTIKDDVQSLGFSNARSTLYGLNSKNTDPFLLKFISVISKSTFPRIKNKIDTAISQKKWLILVFHRTDEDGNAISTRHELIQQIIDYVKQQNIRVVTNSEGVKIMNSLN